MGMPGGKMKSNGTQYWYSPNTAATNESGFCGFLGGYRYSFNGDFTNVRRSTVTGGALQSTIPSVPIIAR